jgi:class 3 adenylate cyclase
MYKTLLLSVAFAVSTAVAAPAVTLPAVIRVGVFRNANSWDNVMYNNVSNSTSSTVLPVYVVESRDVIAGIRAAFKEVNDAGGIYGSTLEAVVVDQMNDDLASAFARPDIYAFMCGEFSGSIPLALTAQAMNKLTLGDVAPTVDFYTSLDLRNAVYTRLPFQVDSAMLVQYMTQSHVRCYRTAVFYYNDSSVAILAEDFANKMASINYPRPEAIPVTSDDTDVAQFMVDAARVIKPGIMGESAQCVVLLEDTHGASLVMKMLSQLENFRFEDYAFFAPSVVRLVDWRAAEGFDQGWYDNFYAVSQVPMDTDRRYQVSRSYLDAMRALEDSGYELPTSASVQGISSPGDRWRPNVAGLEAYVTARLFIEVAKATSPFAFSGGALVDTIYRQKLWTVDDWSLGPFSDGCVGRGAETTTFQCVCKSGTRRMFMSRVNGTTGLQSPVYDDVAQFEVGIAELAIPATACDMDSIGTQVPLASPNIHAVIVDNELDPRLARIAKLFSTDMYGFVELIKTLGFGRKIDLDIVSLAVPPNVSLNAMVLNTMLPTMFRVQGYAALATNAPEDFADVSALLMFAPLRYHYADRDVPVVPFSEWNPSWIPFFPTMTDFVNTAVDMLLTANPNTEVHVIADTNYLSWAAQRMMNHNQKVLSSSRVLFESNDVAHRSITAETAEDLEILDTVSNALDSIASSAAVVIASQNDAVLRAVFAHCSNTSTGPTIVVASSEFVVFDVLNELGAPSVRSNVYYTTGLSAWGEADVAGNAFVLTDPAQAYMATISGLVWLAAGQLNDDNSAAAYMDTIYTTQNIGPSFVSTIAGPFVNKSCGHKTPLNDHPGGDCQCSKGLTTFHVRRVQDWSSAIAQPTSADGMAAATRAPVHEFDYDGSCGMPYDALYVPPEDTTLRDALIASGVGLFFVIVIAVIVRLAIVRNRRDNTFAPTDGRKPFAMVFTDIQSSTSLWARAPQHMAPAVDLHHELLRGAVKKYRGYEVKTIGDSFMVAFKDLRDAVAFGLAIQSTLFEADWGTTVIDDTYQELITDAEERRQLEEAQKATFDNTPLSAPNNPTSSPSKRPAKPDFERVEDTQGYDDTQWHGLRVRVGIHFGVGDAKLDPITRGYDYYGTTVNLFLLDHADIPEDDVAVSVARHKLIPAEGDGNLGHGVVVTVEGLCAKIGTRVPQRHGFVPAARVQGVGERLPDHTVDGVDMSSKCLAAFARLHIPHPRGVIQ